MCDHRLYTKIRTLARGPTPWIVLILCATAAIHLSGSFWMGYLSDDYMHLENAPSIPIFRPLEIHHFSPAITMLFKAAAAGIFPPLAWHLLALVVHMANVVMFFAIARTGLGLNIRHALAATAVFSAAAACYEAVAWISAIGYVMVTLPIFTAIFITFRVAHHRLWRTSSLLAILQLMALLMWDWGILLLPMVFVTVVLWMLPRREISISTAIKMLLPSACICCCVAVAKSMVGYQAGYHSISSDVFVWMRILIPIPIVSLLPNMSGTLMNSGPALFLTVASWGLLAWFTIKNEVVRLSLALYMVCWLPVLAFAGPQSRYVYIGTPFFAIASVELLRRIPAKRFAGFLIIAFVASHIFFAIQRSRLWLGAYNSAMAVRDTITDIEVPDGRELLIVNLPDQYGPPELTWRPFVWRNGSSSFGRPFVRVSTPDCSFSWKVGPIPVMKRQYITRMYPDATIYEVRYKTPGDWREFEVSPFDSAGRKDATEQ